jgi:sn-glycerol 3-phosphate transport system ATP-binding protein
MATLQLSGIRKDFGATPVIRGVDLNVSDGEFVVIVGPSGCGKSTLLRLIAGLDRADAGGIRIGDRSVDDMEPKDRNIAMVFQNYALYPHMSVFDNMAYSLKIAGLSRAEIAERIGAVAAMLELNGLLARRPRDLSGGQRQRVAMGRAIVRNPDVFLFDEPLSNLDAKLRVQMRLEIKDLQRRLGVTSIYVTHDQVEAMTLANRLVVMNKGIAEQIDTPLAVYARPATLFVAGFIGSPAMNLIRAETTEDRRLTAAGGVPLPMSADLAPGRQVAIGVRPEHLRLDADARTALTVRVELVEALGADTLAHGRLGDTGPRLTVRLPGDLRVAERDVLRLTFAPESCHWFDAASGQRLNC